MSKDLKAYYTDDQGEKILIKPTNEYIKLLIKLRIARLKEEKKK